MTAVDAIRTSLAPLTGADDASVVVDFIGDAELVLLGESVPNVLETFPTGV